MEWSRFQITRLIKLQSILVAGDSSPNVNLTNTVKRGVKEQFGNSEQLCNDQNVPYYQFDYII